MEECSKYGKILSEQEAKEILLNHVMSKCCYGKTPAMEMTIKTMETSSVYHYILETYGENRSVKTKRTKVNAGPPLTFSGPVPNMWHVEVDYPIFFTECKKKIVVPNSICIIMCNRCLGLGRHTCSSCSGMGSRHNSGASRQNCSFCGGSGNQVCSECGGSGRVKEYKQLTVSWKNNMTDYVVQYTTLPKEKIPKVQGELAFEEEANQLSPLTHFGDDALKAASIQVLDQHKRTIKDDVILRQRHTVRVVPVVQVHYAWKDKTDYFFIYGVENKVYIPNYPQSCCGFCTVL